MKVLTCRAARPRLQAFHDGELSVGDQIAVGAHLEWCSGCAALYADLRFLRATLRTTATGRLAALSQEESATLQAAVVGRVRAERTASFRVRVLGMFDDMHFVYAGLGAAVAMLVCIMSVTSMWRFATHGRPDSLAALVDMLGSQGSNEGGVASPRSNETPVSVDSRVLMPVALNGAFSTLVDPADSGESVFMIAEGYTITLEPSTFRAVVTREGTVANPELLRVTSDRNPIAPGTQEAEAAQVLMGAVSRARFEPARVDGLPVAVNMVWLVANTTVRAEKQAVAHHEPAAPKKPIAWRMGAGLRAASA
jgi:hypothetical protein